MEKPLQDKFIGCIVGGAIGDAVGSHCENAACVSDIDFDQVSGITDDTQLTLATCESILKDVCFITHKNDETYVGALAVLYALDLVINNNWPPGEQLLRAVIPHPPNRLP